MTTIIAIFCAALVFSLVLTPLAARIGKYIYLVDIPNARSVHKEPIPRIGGIAIYLSFYLSFVPGVFYRTSVIDLVVQDPRIFYMLLGACVACGLGVWDDSKTMDPRTKLLVQVLAGAIAFAGGIRIETVGLPWGVSWHLGWLAMPATVFWVVAIMNAINLTDGLDGLAAGISFFVALVLMVFCVLFHSLDAAVLLASLAGATLGFLRYNLNPATVFLGDGGSYFLGYMLAVLSILGSVKSHATATILIPIIALGLPLMDTFWSAARRFMVGKGLFDPDRDHIHHRLIRMGYSHQRAVLILYGVTILMGAGALFLAHARDERVALLLLVLGAAVILGIRKLGYLEYLAVDKFIGWLTDISDEVGIRHSRRTFLSHQMDIFRSATLDDLWHQLVSAARLLKMDYMQLRLERGPATEILGTPYSWHAKGGSFAIGSYDPAKTFFISLPLTSKGRAIGSLVLARDVGATARFSHQVLRRVEHLRRTVEQTLAKLVGTGATSVAGETAKATLQVLDGPEVSHGDITR